MLQALGSPISFVVLLVSYLAAVTLGGWVSSVAAARVGPSSPAAQGRLVPDPRRQVDPFGSVAALISGFGWWRPVDVPGRLQGARLLVVCLAGPAAVLLVAGVALATYAVGYGSIGGALSQLLRVGAAGLPALPLALLLVGVMHLYVGLLGLLPLPPLPGARLLFALAPRSPGWQKAEHYLVEQNIGVVVLLVLMIIPLGGPVPLLPAVLDSLSGGVLGRLTGG